MNKINKAIARKQCLESRNSLSIEEIENKSNEIWKKLKKCSFWSSSKNILLYADYLSEVRTVNHFNEIFEEKNIFCPLVEGDNMNFYQIQHTQDLHEGYRGIMEPIADIETLFSKQSKEYESSLLIIPGTAFDIEGGRIGYGKGFYDRFIEKNELIPRIALAFECQIVDKVPMENHDYYMNQIITEARNIRCNRKKCK